MERTLKTDELWLGDCLDIMQSIPDKSIDCIICDLPYHISACKWDCLIPFDKLWQQYKRIIKPNRAICLFGVQPFTSALVNSNLPWYKYNWVWYKHSGSNFLSSHLQPLKVTEDICVFADGATSYTKKGEHVLYNPQFTEGKPYVCKSGKQRADTAIVRDKPDAKSKQGGWITKSDGRRYPTNILDFPKDKVGGGKSLSCYGKACGLAEIPHQDLLEYRRHNPRQHNGVGKHHHCRNQRETALDWH